MLNRKHFVLRALFVGSAAAIFGLLLTQPIKPATTSAQGAPAQEAASTSPVSDMTPFYCGLRWRLLGPFRGGRVDAVAGVPGRPSEFYFGSVNGGVWKSIDAGRVWLPVFDAQPVASIGAIAVAPSAPDTVYVGSGESTLRDSTGFGDGMYKSTDAGKTWAHIGLEGTEHIGKIAVDPRNPDIAFVAAIGHLYASNSERGIYRTTDGGKTWKKVLFKNDDVGAVEVVIDPTESKVVYAGLWNTRRPPWFTYGPTNGPGGGIFKSTDGGDTWTQLSAGLPKENIGRTGIAVCPSEPKRVYAVVDCLSPEAKPETEPDQGTAPTRVIGGLNQGGVGQGGFFRSDDAGQTWTKLTNDPAIWGRGWYFEKIAVDPQNPDIVYVPNQAVCRTKDGGKTWDIMRGSPGGDDYHQAWVSPDDTNVMIVASDQGAIITHNAKADDPRTITWSSWLNQPTAQLYHLSVDYRFPYWVTAAQQDSGAVAVRSRGKFAEISMRDWEPIEPGGESGYTAGDPLNPGIVYGLMGTRYNLETNTPIRGTTSPRSAEPARHDWTQPLALSKADPRSLYYANQFLFKTTDGAKTWTQISPDLTRPDPGIPATLDAAAAAQTDRNGKRGVIYTIAPSPLNAPLLWIGTDDGLIHLTADDGKTWSNVTPPEITSWSRITMLEASHFDVNTAYASVDRHQLADFDPYIYRTRDTGRTWQKITAGLPAGAYVHTVKEDPQHKGLLFAGTEHAVYFSLDDGDHWHSLQLNLPVTSMRDMEIYQNDLILATHGRGLWVIDDISPLRQLDAEVIASDMWLFKPADCINVITGGDNGTPLQKDEPQATNAANGARIDFYLKVAATGPVTLEIFDSNGASLRRFSTDPGAQSSGENGRRAGRGRAGGARGGLPTVSPLWQTIPEPFSAEAGMHRIIWNSLATPQGRGRGGPETAPAGGGGRGRGEQPRLTGTFTAKLTANGKTLTQTFAVKPDPRERKE